jgi:hypothetical protein
MAWTNLDGRRTQDGQRYNIIRPSEEGRIKTISTHHFLMLIFGWNIYGQTPSC